MRIIEETTRFHIALDTAVVIGKFDGFHRGHQKLVQKLLELKAQGLVTVVFTFVPSPAAFFSGEPQEELTTVSERRRLFAKAGVDYLIEYPFNEWTVDMEPERYISEVLVERLRAKYIVAGEDVSFGRNGQGDCRLLQQMAAEGGYQVIIIDKVLHEGREISSTYVREAVKRGDMELAQKLLGRPYHINGVVVHGNHLGTQMGIPTANIIPPAEKLLPPNGVYYSRIKIGKIDYSGITNIGTKPTVSGEAALGVETFIYDWHYKIYGEDVEVYLLSFKRPEVRFDGIEALEEQLAEDIEAGYAYHNIASYDF